MRHLRVLIGLGLIAGAIGWMVTAPKPLDAMVTNGLTGDASRGEGVFHAAGCASCHTAPDAAEGDGTILSGGQRFPSDFGTFLAPNISPDPTHGIGGWSAYDLANAMLRGVSPAGQHYYPAFPYTSYARAEPQDVVDLHAYLMTLPTSDAASQPHEVGFPFNIRRALGGWKLLFASADWIMPAETDQLVRGRYLVEALGHCGECHTPRGALGNSDHTRWLEGAPDPSGKGKIPAITPSQLDWSAEDLTYYFESGFTPDFDSAGGHMAHVVENLMKLPPQDRTAITAYLKALP